MSMCNFRARLMRHKVERNRRSEIFGVREFLDNLSMNLLFMIGH